MGDGETVLEYGIGLADHIMQRQTREPDTARVAAHEVTVLSDAVNAFRYGPEQARSTAGAQVNEHWQRLRGYLPRISRRQP